MLASGAEKMAKRYGVVPLAQENGFLLVATSNPFDIVGLDDIRFITDMYIKPVLGLRREIETCIEGLYHQLHNTVSEIELIENVEYKTDVEKIADSDAPDECDSTIE